MIEVLEAICGELRLSNVLAKYNMSDPMIVNVAELSNPYGMDRPFVVSWRSEYKHDILRETRKFIMKCSCIVTVSCMDHEVTVSLMKSRYAARRQKKIDLRDPESIDRIIEETAWMAHNGT